MAHKIYMVQNDTAPPIDFIISKADGSVFNLTGCTVKFFIKRSDTGVQTNTGHDEVQYTDRPAGKVQYAFATNDIPVEGTYNCDLQVTDAGGKIQTEYEVTQIIARPEVA